MFLLSINCVAYKTCSTKSFDNICGSCAFVGGKVDGGCKDKNENLAKACLATSYPAMVVKYPLGMCPALDSCINALQSCVDTNGPANHKHDCVNPLCRPCYPKADACAMMASSDCDDEERCGDTKCEKKAGEDKSTCCADCGCDQGLECVGDQCVKPQATESGVVSGMTSGLPPDYRVEWGVMDFLGCFPLLAAPLAMLGAAFSKQLH